MFTTGPTVDSDVGRSMIVPRLAAHPTESRLACDDPSVTGE